MSNSIKDALTKSGIVEPQPEPTDEPKSDPKKWLNELPEDDHKPYIPFDAPARLKTKPSTSKK